MNAMYAVCLIAVLMHLIFLPSFFWSLKRRELREDDEEAYRSVQEEATPATRSRRPIPEATVPVTRARMMVLFGYLITLFVLILASLVYITVAAPPVPPGAD